MSIRVSAIVIPAFVILSLSSLGNCEASSYAGPEALVVVILDEGRPLAGVKPTLVQHIGVGESKPVDPLRVAQFEEIIKANNVAKTDAMGTCILYLWADGGTSENTRDFKIPVRLNFRIGDQKFNFNLNDMFVTNDGFVAVRHDRVLRVVIDISILK